MNALWRVALLPLLCCGARMPAPVWAHPDSVTVVMVDNRFQPDHVVFQAGHATVLTLVNRGKEMHEFTAPAFLKSATVREPNQLSNGGTDIVVQPGQTLSVTLLPHQKGEFALSCADHDWDGMVGHISVR
jgi:plastocyanin